MRAVYARPIACALTPELTPASSHASCAEEAYAWHEAYDRAQEEARQYRYKHAEEIERQEWEQVLGEPRACACGYA